jgi:uncharacterized protein (DUF302 family)
MTGTAAGHVVTKASAGTVAETVDRLTTLLAARGLKVFDVIDHSGEAAATGTPVMEAAPLAALDLPLKVLVWDDGGATKVSYTAPAALAERYGLSDDLAARLAGIEALVDAVVAR